MLKTESVTITTISKKDDLTCVLVTDEDIKMGIEIYDIIRECIIRRAMVLDEEGEVDGLIIRLEDDEQRIYSADQLIRVLEIRVLELKKIQLKQKED